MNAKEIRETQHRIDNIYSLIRRKYMTNIKLLELIAEIVELEILLEKECNQ